MQLGSVFFRASERSFINWEVFQISHQHWEILWTQVRTCQQPQAFVKFAHLTTRPLSLRQSPYFLNYLSCVDQRCCSFLNHSLDLQWAVKLNFTSKSSIFLGVVLTSLEWYLEIVWELFEEMLCLASFLERNVFCWCFTWCTRTFT